MQSLTGSEYAHFSKKTKSDSDQSRSRQSPTDQFRSRLSPTLSSFSQGKVQLCAVSSSPRNRGIYISFNFFTNVQNFLLQNIVRKKSRRQQHMYYLCVISYLLKHSIITYQTHLVLQYTREKTIRLAMVKKNQKRTAF